MYKDHSHDAPHNSVSTPKRLTGTFTFTFTLSVDDRLLCFATQNFPPEEESSLEQNYDTGDHICDHLPRINANPLLQTPTGTGQTRKRNGGK